MSADQRTWAEAVRRVSAEAAGVVALQIVLQSDIPEMLGHAILGDATCAQLIRLVAQMVRRIRKAPPGKPMLCACCPAGLRGGRYSLAIATPYRDDATEALVLAICPKCGTDPDSVMEAARRGLRRIWPDCHSVDIHPGEGHA